MSLSGRELWKRISRRRLTIDGTDFAVTVHERDALTVYVPLAREIAARSHEAGGPRFLVGIAGPPGSGKTVTAIILAAVLEELGIRPANSFTNASRSPLVVPLDGFHYPNSYLDTHDGLGHDGKVHRLRALKGQPVTFDAERALSLLRRLRRGESLRLPVYSRTLHDPVEEALPVGPEHRILLVEGNYLFLDAEPWREIRELFDLRVFVTAPREVLAAQVAERHIRGGRTQAEAWRKLRDVDGPNMEAVAPTRRYAHIVIEGVHGGLVMQITSASLEKRYV